MQTLYDAGWQGASCGAVAGQVAAIALAATAGVFVLIGIILWVMARRGHKVDLRSMRMPLIGVGVLVLGIIAVVLFSGQTTHRILVGQGGLVFEGCQGLSPYSDTIRFEDVEGVAHRTQRGAGRSATVWDEMVVVLRNRAGERVIPLSTDPAVLDPALLRRVVPAEVIEAWRDSLAQRGGRLPAGP